MYAAILLFALQAAIVEPPPPTVSLPHGCRTEARFLGFSRNQQVAAEQLDIRCQRGPGDVERLHLVRLYSVETGALRAVFQAAFPERHRHGQAVATSPASWQARFPGFARVLPVRAWQRIAAAAHFAAKQHEFADEVVQLRPLANGLAHAHLEGRALTVSSPAGQPLAFVFVVRTLAGELVETLPTSGSPGTASLRLFYSRDGRRLATILTQHGQSRLLLTSKPLPDPIDLLGELGAPLVMQWSAKQALDDFRDLLPAHDPEAAAFAEDAFSM